MLAGGPSVHPHQCLRVRVCLLFPFIPYLKTIQVTGTESCNDGRNTSFSTTASLSGRLILWDRFWSFSTKIVRKSSLCQSQGPHFSIFGNAEHSQDQLLRYTYLYNPFKPNPSTSLNARFSKTAKQIPTK